MAENDRAQIDEIRERIVLSELVGEDIALVADGGEFKACCPFHDEKTASFTVTDAKGFYHCFGCGAHGDAFKYVMEQRGMDFPEALRYLAERAQVKLVTRRSQPPAAEADTRQAVLAQYRGWLAGHEAAATRRHPILARVPKALREELGLGWAPAEARTQAAWEALQAHTGWAGLQRAWRLTGSQGAAEALIVPLIGTGRVPTGFVAVDARGRAWPHGVAPAAHPPLLNEGARVASRRVRQETPVWITDDVGTWLVITAAGSPAMCAPWPGGIEASTQALERRLRSWPNVAVALTHRTVYLYDHPILLELLRGYRPDREARVTEWRPGQLPRLDRCERLSEYLIRRSERDARVDIPGGRERLARVVGAWAGELPRSLFQFVLSERLRERLAALPPGTGPQDGVDHPLAWPEDIRRVVRMMDEHPQLRRPLPRGMPGAGLVRRLCGGSRQSGIDRALLAALARQHPLPAQMSAAQAKAWLERWFQDAPMAPRPADSQTPSPVCRLG